MPSSLILGYRWRQSSPQNFVDNSCGVHHPVPKVREAIEIEIKRLLSVVVPARDLHFVSYGLVVSHKHCKVLVSMDENVAQLREFFHLRKCSLHKAENLGFR
tara:strand:- start:734 stop:1039 length:306 start_codon:yes stop_codon:yes gene_type:complete